MKILSALFITALLTLTVSLIGISDAEAKRFGGARSFGGKSRFSSPYRRSAAPTRSAGQQKAYQKNQAARQTLSRRGGFMGMLGGLALGGLLGAMFFGGAFEGINFMDILIFGGVAYLLFKLFAAKGAAQRQTSYQRNSGNYQKSDNYDTASKNKSYYDAQPGGFDTDVLFKKQNKSTVTEPSAFQQDADFKNPVMPEGFNQADFLSGAKTAFYDLQSAWDKNDLAEIRGLTTDKVFSEIQQQLKTSDTKNQTDVLKLDAELLDVRELDAELEAVVLFNSIIREGKDLQAEQVQEVWHFVKPRNSHQPTWFLDGIQQLEN